MAVATMTPSRVDELLDVERTDAWQRYLDAIRGQSSVRYEEVEPWAWSRLQQRLRAIAARERVLKTPARRTDAAEGSSPAGGPG